MTEPENKIPLSRSDFAPEPGFAPANGWGAPANFGAPAGHPAPAAAPAPSAFSAPAPAEYAPAAAPADYAASAAPAPTAPAGDAVSAAASFAAAPAEGAPVAGPAVVPAPIGAPIPAPAGKAGRGGKKARPEKKPRPEKKKGEKKKGGKLLPILLIAAAVLLAAAAVVLFVYPGFLRKNAKDAQPPATSEPGSAEAADTAGVPAELAGDIKKIDGFGSFTVGLSGSGKVFVWGETEIDGVDLSKIPDEVTNAKIVDVAAGTDHIVAVSDDGIVYCWGCSDNGQYGPVDEDTAIEKDIIPMPEGLADHSEKIDAGSIKKLICGDQMTALLMNDGALYVWGKVKSPNGNLEYFSDKHSVNARHPVPLTDIAFTGNYLVGLTEDGDKIISGFRDVFTKYTEELGTGETPVKAKNFLRDHGGVTIAGLAANSRNVCLLLSDGTAAFSCEKDFDAEYAPMPALQDGETFVRICGGTEHYAGLTSNGRVLVWGGNSCGQLNVPEDLSGVSEIFVTACRTYCIDADGKLICAFGGEDD